MGIKCDYLFEILTSEFTYHLGHIDLFASHGVSQCFEMHSPLWRNYAKLCQVSAQRIDYLGTLTEQHLPGPEEHCTRLMSLTLHGDKSHRRTRRCLNTRFSIGRVILLTLHKRFCIDGRDQLNFMA